jgi:hypothetical protein
MEDHPPPGGRGQFRQNRGGARIEACFIFAQLLGCFVARIVPKTEFGGPFQRRSSQPLEFGG